MVLTQCSSGNGLRLSTTCVYVSLASKMLIGLLLLYQQFYWCYYLSSVIKNIFVIAIVISVNSCLYSVILVIGNLNIKCFELFIEY